MQLEKILIAKATGRELELVSNAYHLWFETYQPIMKEAGVELSPESFHRSQYLTLIHNEGAPLSFSLSSFIHLGIDGAANMRYFDPMSETLMKRFKTDHPKVMTIEWVTVHPKERERFSKVRQSNLIMGCSFQVFKDSDADVAMGFSRIDLGADRIAEQFGCVGQELTSLYGIDCRVMTIRKPDLKPHRLSVVQRAIDDLCGHREFEISA